MSSYGATSATICTPTASNAGRPAENSSSRTHWVNGSATTGHRSAMPVRAATSSASPFGVAGVMRSTIELGNAVCSSIHSASSGSAAPAKAVKTRRAMCPLPGMLSHDITVNDATPRARRRRNASVISPNVVRGIAFGVRSAATSGADRSNSPVELEMLYPPSVTVSETMRVVGAAIVSITFSGSSGAKR